MPTKIERLAIEAMAAGKPINRFEVQLIAAIEEKWPGAIERAKARRLKERDEERFTGAPEWAKKLVRKYEASTRSITLVVRRSRTKPYTSGHCAYWSRRLVVTLGGRDEREHRYVVLHEIAHANAPGGHDEEFYDELYRMVKAEGLYRYCVDAGSAHYGSQGLRAAARRARASRAA